MSAESNGAHQADRSTMCVLLRVRTTGSGIATRQRSSLTDMLSAMRFFDEHLEASGSPLLASPLPAIPRLPLTVRCLITSTNHHQLPLVPHITASQTQLTQQIEGDLFYPITSTTWEPSSDLFSTSPSTLAAYQRLRPFQAFSTWGGMVVLAATPFLAPHNLRFRRGDQERRDQDGEAECQASECELINRDMWEGGWGRVQVVPSVQVRVLS